MRQESIHFVTLGGRKLAIGRAMQPATAIVSPPGFALTKIRSWMHEKPDFWAKAMKATKATTIMAFVLPFPRKRPSQPVKHAMDEAPTRP